MSDARCDCCDLPVYSCGRAAQAAQAADEARTRAGFLSLPGVLAATYPGSCSRCWARFPVGTAIRRDGDDGWRSLECCATDEEAARAGAMP